MNETSIHTGDLVEIENQGAWTGPYEVVDFSVKIDFISDGRIEILYLQPPEHPDPALVGYPVHLLHAHRAERRSDGLLAFTYPRSQCRLALPK